jgi:hypothetical protein
VPIATPASPDETAFRSDLDGEPFRVGALMGHWHLVESTWPRPIIAIAATPRLGAPNEVQLRFELSGYPVHAPTSTPWDTTAQAPLSVDQRPAGRRASNIFRRDGWNHGEGLYVPYDRLAMNGHENWKSEFPHLWWKSDCDITFYLQQIYEVLHDEDYTGV